MRADYGIVKCVQSEVGGECVPTQQWEQLNQVALGVLAFYVGVLPGTFFYLLFRERRLLREGLETPRTRALAFLHRQYRPQFWYYELVEMGRKAYLVGFAVFLPPGSLVQLIWSLLPAICMLVVELVASPKREQQYASVVVHLSTISTLLMIAVIRTSSLVLDLEQSNTDVQESIWSFLYFEVTQTLIILFLSAGIVALVVVGFIINGMRRSRLETLPLVKAADGQARLRRLMKLEYHVYLSHVASGRKQVREIEQILREALPGIRLFVDPDGLAEVQRGVEVEIAASQTMVVFVSRGYFIKQKSLKEFVTALRLEQRRKDFAVMFACETDRAAGALTEAEACEEFELACQRMDDENRARKDGDTDVIEGGPVSWQLPKDDDSRRWIKDQIRKKIKAAQQGTDGTMWYQSKAHRQSSLLQIAEHVVDELDVRSGLRTEGGALNEQLEVPEKTLEGFHVYCSPNNAGAFDFVYDELRHRFNGSLKIASSARDLIAPSGNVSGGGGGHDLQEELPGKVGAPGRGVWARVLLRALAACCASLVSRCCCRGGKSSGKKRSKPHSVRGEQDHESWVPRGACVFILYLDGRTWTSSRKDLLKEELLLQLAVAREREIRPMILLLHECDTSVHARHPILFERFYDPDQTPPELIKAGLYDCEIIRLGREPYRKLSLLEAAGSMLKLFSAPSRFSSVRSRWIDRDQAAFAATQSAGLPPSTVLVSNRIRDIDLLDDAAIDNDDDSGTSTLAMSPIMHEFKTSVLQRMEAKGKVAEHRGTAAFTKADVGRILTIKRKRVTIRGVERHVVWSRRVERTAQETAAKNNGTKAKILDRFKWVEWRPFPEGASEIVKATILSVDEVGVEDPIALVGGAVRVSLENSVEHSFSNPERSTSALKVFGSQTLATATGSVGHSSGGSAKQMADEFAEKLGGTFFSAPKPPVRGAKADITPRELCTLTGHDLPLELAHEVKNARYLWRSKANRGQSEEQLKKGQHYVGAEHEHIAKVGGSSVKGDGRTSAQTRTNGLATKRWSKLASVERSRVRSSALNGKRKPNGSPTLNVKHLQRSSMLNGGTDISAHAFTSRKPKRNELFDDFDADVAHFEKSGPGRERMARKPSPTHSGNGVTAKAVFPMNGSRQLIDWPQSQAPTPSPVFAPTALANTDAAAGSGAQAVDEKKLQSNSHPSSVSSTLATIREGLDDEGAEDADLVA